MINSGISSRVSQLGTTRNNKKSKSKSKERHFKEITIHDYLHIDSKRQKNKRELERLIDEEYKRQYIFPFKPTISEKSKELALIKYSKINERESIER